MESDWRGGGFHVLHPYKALCQGEYKNYSILLFIKANSSSIVKHLDTPKLCYVGCPSS